MGVGVCMCVCVCVGGGGVVHEKEKHRNARVGGELQGRDEEIVHTTHARASEHEHANLPVIQQHKVDAVGVGSGEFLDGVPE